VYSTDRTRTRGGGPGGRLMGAGLLAFWIGLMLAVRLYPGEYDWRYMTISSLLYPDRNPRGHAWGRGGLVVCAVCALWSLLRRRRSPLGAGALLLSTGYGCMALCALLPSPFMGVSRLHELLALVAFILLCAGVSWMTFMVRRDAAGSADRPVDWLVPLGAAALPFVPVVCAVITQSYASRAGFPWVSLDWRARGIPVILSFALWEWITCAVCTLCLLWLLAGGRSLQRVAGAAP